MRAPLSLIVPAAVLGVVFPAVFRMAAVESDRPVLAALLYLVGCAVIPVVATIVAYRHGYDRGLARGRREKKVEAPSEPEASSSSDATLDDGGA